MVWNMIATLEPDLLRSFVAIAESGSFTAAAQRVHRTQSAVSMQIRRLEDLIGQALFTREGRQVRLTPAGEVLLGHARRILQAHRDALAEFDRTALAGEVTIGAPDDYASTFLPRVLARFAETHARVHVSVVCRPSVELVGCIADRSIDLALVSEGSGERGGVLVRREPLVWVAAARHRPEELDPLPLAVFQPGCVFRRAMTESLAASGRTGRIAYTSLSIAGIHAALDSGLAVSALLRSGLRPGLRVLDERDGFPPLPELGLVLLRAEAEPSPAVERLEAAILAHFREAPGLSLAA